MSNTRFAVAVHVLALLALEKRALTSDYIAGSVQTNPVVVRRILGSLREAGIVQAVPGPGGGFALAHNPRELNLRTIFEAVGDRDLISIHADTNPQCPVGRNIEEVLSDVTTRAENALLHTLEETTLSRVLSQIQRCEKAG